MKLAWDILTLFFILTSQVDSTYLSCLSTRKDVYIKHRLLKSRVLTADCTADIAHAADRTITSATGYEEGRIRRELVILQGTSVCYFPRNLHNFYENLKYLRIVESSIKNVNEDDFFGLKIVLLEISYSSIVTLDFNAFASIKNTLNYFTFVSNGMEHIENFKDMPKGLMYVNFSDNPCVDNELIANNLLDFESTLSIMLEKCLLENN